jgi:long-chain acyl-CoA synthetase
MNYKETMTRYQNFGSGLVALGLKPGPDTLVGVYSQNNPEWVLSEYGIYSNSMVVVPLYDTLGPDASRFITGYARCWSLFASQKSDNFRS